jgi:hypothetical protein
MIDDVSWIVDRFSSRSNDSKDTIFFKVEVDITRRV